RVRRGSKAEGSLPTESSVSASRDSALGEAQTEKRERKHPEPDGHRPDEPVELADQAEKEQQIGELAIPEELEERPGARRRLAAHDHPVDGDPGDDHAAERDRTEEQIRTARVREVGA